LARRRAFVGGDAMSAYVIFDVDIRDTTRHKVRDECNSARLLSVEVLE
jgi:hypothetical protein